MSFKKKIKKIPGAERIWSTYNALRQSRIIEKEEKLYCNRAIEMGISLQEPSVAEVYIELVERLNKRGIQWPPKPVGRPLHILYASFPGRWERHNIPPQLGKLGDVTCYFVYERGIASDERLSMRRFIDMDFPSFMTKLHSEKPVDMVLSYFSGAEILPETIEKIKAMGIPTFSFHWDDRLYFHGRKIGNQWSGPVSVCNAYDLNLTNAPESLIKYRVEGALAIFWPEAANPEHFYPQELPFKYDVTFIGAKYGKRAKFIDNLRKNNINVAAFGPGWEGGQIPENEMVSVYAQSRINLGFGYIGFSDYQCLKGRDFEVPSCGVLYLTTHNNALERVYDIGNEIVTYNSAEDCVSKIKVLLADPDRCEKIRRNARAAIVNRHTWLHRIQSLITGKSGL